MVEETCGAGKSRKGNSGNGSGEMHGDGFAVGSRN
jgi:hypothetical protein